MSRTSGFRKILIIDNTFYGNISNIIKMANITKHCALLYNGIIYVKNNDKWFQTVFTIEDFE